MNQKLNKSCSLSKQEDLHDAGHKIGSKDSYTCLSCLNLFGLLEVDNL